MLPSLLGLLVLLPIATDSPSPEQQYQALADEYEAAYQAFVKANDEAKTEADLKALDNYPGRNPRAYAPAFLVLAKAHPGTPAAEDALLWICSHTFGFAPCEEAKRQLVRDHIRSHKLGPALGYQGHYADYFEGTEAFFRAVIAHNPHHDIQGLAHY